MRNAMATGSQPIQRIYRRSGDTIELPLSCAEPDPDLVRVPSIADIVPVVEIMTRDVTCARRDLGARFLVDLMTRHRIGCMPVVEEPGRPVGMVTKYDVLERLQHDQEDETAGFATCTANDLMMPLAITLGSHATVAHAAALMAAEDVHHLPIVDEDGRLIGIVSSMDIVRWLARNDGFGHR
jgi:CBS domain-containing protein